MGVINWEQFMKSRNKIVAALAVLISTIFVLYLGGRFLYKEEKDKSAYAALQRIEYYNRKYDGVQKFFPKVNGEIDVLSAMSANRAGKYGLWIALNQSCNGSEVCAIGNVEGIVISCNYVDYLQARAAFDPVVRKYLRRFCHK